MEIKMPVAELKQSNEITSMVPSPTELKQPNEIISMVPSPDQSVDWKPKITVVGLGGAGGNAVNNMIRSDLKGIQFIVCNTDAQALNQSRADRRIQLGGTVTQGLGAGSRAEVGRDAAEESLEQIMNEISNCNMIFITAGMGGGTGTGAAPVVARAAREKGILTVAVVTKPFNFEGDNRMKNALKGIEELSKFVDTLIIIPNQNLFRIANEKTTFVNAFEMVDDVLNSGVRGVTDLIMAPGLINLDFADIRSVMSEMGKAMMGTGEASGENRAIIAAEAAISNPLLDDVSMKGAQGVLINITGGLDMTLYEVDEAANRIREEVDPNANIIIGSTFDEKMNGLIRVSVVATGIETDMSRVRIQRQHDEAYQRARMDNEASKDTLELDQNVDFAEDTSADLAINLIGLNSSTEEVGSAAQWNLENGSGSSIPADSTHHQQKNEQAFNQNIGQNSPNANEMYYQQQQRYLGSETQSTAPAPRKKSLLSRFADTMRGNNTAREEPVQNQYVNPQPEQVLVNNEERSRYFMEVTETSKPVEKNIHDIPAYLRRNQK